MGTGRLDRLLLTLKFKAMSRVQIAKKLADAAREAQQFGRHRKAAQLFAEALKVLTVDGPLRVEWNAAKVCGENGNRDDLPRQAGFEATYQGSLHGGSRVPEAQSMHMRTSDIEPPGAALAGDVPVADDPIRV